MIWAPVPVLALSSGAGHFASLPHCPPLDSTTSESVPVPAVCSPRNEEAVVSTETTARELPTVHSKASFVKITRLGIRRAGFYSCFGHCPPLAFCFLICTLQRLTRQSLQSPMTLRFYYLMTSWPLETILIRLARQESHHLDKNLFFSFNC